MKLFCNLLLCIVTAIIGCKAYIDKQYVLCVLSLIVSILNYFVFANGNKFCPHKITMTIDDTQFLTIGDILYCRDFDNKYNGYYQITKVVDKNNLELDRIPWLKAWKTKLFSSHNEKQ